MPKSTGTNVASTTVAASRSLADSPRVRSTLRRIKATAAERGVWLPGRHGRKPVPVAELPPAPSDRQVTLALMERLGKRAAGALEAPHQIERGPGSTAEAAVADHGEHGLPHPVVTDTNLAQFLSQATDASNAIASRGAPTGPRLASETYIDQAMVNDALVNCLHQLDHRSLAQRDQLGHVESSISEVLRRLERLEHLIDALQDRTASEGSGLSPVEGTTATEPVEQNQVATTSPAPDRPRIST